MPALFLLAGGASVTFRHTPPIGGWTTRCPAGPRFRYHFREGDPQSRTNYPLGEAARPFRRYRAPLLVPADKEGTFGERRYSLSGTSFLRGRHSCFTDQSLPLGQLLTRRHTYGSKRALSRAANPVTSPPFAMRRLLGDPVPLLRFERN